jgi:hypothetical protein
MKASHTDSPKLPIHLPAGARLKNPNASRSYVAKMKQRAANTPVRQRASKHDSVNSLDRRNSLLSLTPEPRRLIVKQTSYEPTEQQLLTWKTDSQDTTPRTTSNQDFVALDQTASFETSISAAREPSHVRSRDSKPDQGEDYSTVLAQLRSSVTPESDSSHDVGLKDLLTTILREINEVKGRMCRIEERMQAIKNADRTEKHE